MKVEAIKPLNYKGKTISVGSIIDIEDSAAKKLIDKKAVEEIKEQKAQTKTGDDKWKL